MRLKTLYQPLENAVFKNKNKNRIKRMIEREISQVCDANNKKTPPNEMKLMFIKKETANFFFINDLTTTKFIKRKETKNFSIPAKKLL